MPHPKVKISDDSGNTATVTSERLDVNAYLNATPTIDIGDVSILAGDGTPITDTVSGRLDVTLRSEYSEDLGHTSSDKGMFVLGVSRATQGNYAATDGDYQELQLSRKTNSPGALVVCGGTKEDGIHTSGDGGIMALAVRNDSLAALGSSDGDYAPLQVDAKGALYINNGITGNNDGVTTVTTAGTDVALAGSTVCKKVDIQAQTDNTGLIAVGYVGVDATEATGTGIILYAGDTYSLEISNLALIYIDATEDGEGVRYAYYT